MTFNFDLFSVFVAIPKIQCPQKIGFMFWCSWYSLRWKCDGVWGPCWIEFTVSDYCDLILIWIKNPSNTHALSTQLSSDKCHTFRHESDDCHTLLPGQQFGWCDWPVTHNSSYWHHKICNISCLNSHFLSQFMLKWSLYRHICLSAFLYYWCLLITSNFENLCLPLETTQPCWSVGTDSEVQIFLAR